MSGIVGTSHSKSKIIGKSLDTAKAWINIKGTGTDGAGGMSTGGISANDSFNVASLTDYATGQYKVHFTKHMSNTNYCLAGLCGDWDTQLSSGALSVDWIWVYAWHYTSDANVDKNNTCVAVFGE